MPPAARLTPARVRAYLGALRAAGNANSTIVTRFFELRSALRIMQPEADLRWLVSPKGTPLRVLLPAGRRAVDVPNSAVLYAWGRDMMRDALRREHPTVRAARYRDGLLIAVLAAVAPRIRTLAATRIGWHLSRHGGCFWLAYTSADVKNRRVIEYPLPPELTSCVERYLEVERPRLLKGRQHDWFWVRRSDGAGMNESDIGSLVRYASKARFGTAFGPHLFRHALATTAARLDASNPGLAAAVLAVSDAVVDAHYNLAKQEHAARDHVRLIDEERRRTRLLAGRLFGSLE
ncbi:integrase [Craurococcus roseus]